MVTIRNFKMPDACCYCSLCAYEYGDRFMCRLTKRIIKGHDKYYHQRDKGCPLEEVPVGKWVEKEVRGSKCLCCSNCGEESGTLYDYNFCPWCGALMEVK